MSKTIVFKPEFEAKLKKLKIKTKFVNNLQQYRRAYSDYSLNELLMILQKAESWKCFIDYAFTWSHTNEGDMYWYQISKL